MTSEKYKEAQRARNHERTKMAETINKPRYEVRRTVVSSFFWDTETKTIISFQLMCDMANELDIVRKKLAAVRGIPR